MAAVSEILGNLGFAAIAVAWLAGFVLFARARALPGKRTDRHW